MNDVKTRENFVADVWAYYTVHGRHDLPWRIPEPDGMYDPYKILVSELMLQQTQVPRVIPKYLQFLEKFPTVRSLANASLGEVLTAWQGLGYNRRAKYLWQAAQQIVRDFGGKVPNNQSDLENLPGVGKNTAGAVRAYAFDEPVVFIETNIRTVYIHHFFAHQTDVNDTEIFEALKGTLLLFGKIKSGSSAEASGLIPKAANEKPKPEIPSVNANGRARVSHREFYWALMDYGTHLKQTVGNAARASKSYTKQSQFKGSLRQIRGLILRELAQAPRSESYVYAAVGDARVGRVLDDLVRENMIIKHKHIYQLP